MNINPLELPFVPFGGFSELPKIKGVYFVLSGNEILYIGKANNLRERWKMHEKAERLEKANADRVAWLEGAGVEKEIELINCFTPKYNVKSNPSVDHSRKDCNYGKDFSKWLDKKFLEFQLSTGQTQRLSTFANMLGFPPPVISMWMSGKRAPRGYAVIEKLASKLGAEIYGILGIEKDERLNVIVATWDTLSEETKQAILRLTQQEHNQSLQETQP